MASSGKQRDVMSPTPSVAGTAVTQIQHKSEALKFKVDTFHGNRSKSRLFIAQLQTYFKLNRKDFPTAEEKILFAQAHLRDGAFNWFEPYFSDWIDASTPNEDKTTAIFDSFGAWVGEFRKVFGDIDEERKAGRELQSLKQTGSATKYASEFHQLSSRLSWEDKPLAALYYAGLKYEVKKEMMPEPKEDLDELIEDSIKIDNRLYELRNEGKKGLVYYRSRPKRQQGVDPHWDPMDLSAMKHGRGPRPKPRGRKRPGWKPNRPDGPPPQTAKGLLPVKKGACYKCGRQGHWARDCKAGPQKLHEMRGGAGASGETPTPHAQLSWTACTDDRCRTHLSDKEGTGWYPKKQAMDRFAAMTSDDEEVLTKKPPLRRQRRMEGRTKTRFSEILDSKPKEDAPYQIERISATEFQILTAYFTDWECRACYLGHEQPERHWYYCPDSPTKKEREEVISLPVEFGSCTWRHWSKGQCTEKRPHTHHVVNRDHYLVPRFADIPEQERQPDDSNDEWFQSEEPVVGPTVERIVTPYWGRGPCNRTSCHLGGEPHQHRVEDPDAPRRKLAAVHIYQDEPAKPETWEPIDLQEVTSLGTVEEDHDKYEIVDISQNHLTMKTKFYTRGVVNGKGVTCQYWPEAPEREEITMRLVVHNPLNCPHECSSVQEHTHQVVGTWYRNLDTFETTDRLAVMEEEDGDSTKGKTRLSSEASETLAEALERVTTKDPEGDAQKDPLMFVVVTMEYKGFTMCTPYWRWAECKNGTCTQKSKKGHRHLIFDKTQEPNHEKPGFVTVKFCDDEKCPKKELHAHRPDNGQIDEIEMPEQVQKQRELLKGSRVGLQGHT